MADSKKYDGSTWNHSTRKLKTATESVGNLIYSNGQPLLDWRIAGSPLGCGEKTKNLFPLDAKRYQMAITDNNKVIDYANGAVFVIPVSVNTSYTFKIYSNDVAVGVVRLALLNKAVPVNNDIVYYVTEILRSKNPALTINTRNYSYLLIQVSGSTYVDVYGVGNLMLNEGPTTLPHEPYGYKIPITCGGVTTDIYIGDSPLYDGDTISMADTGISIPTTEGANNITVDTTVPPSEFTATWTGWHNANVKEWDGQIWA